MKSFFTLLLLLAMPLIAWGDDNAAEAQRQLMIYRNMVKARQENPQGYEALYHAYILYKNIIENSEKGGETYWVAKSALREIFGGLGESVYYYYGRNDADKYTQMGVAYVDISLMLSMRDEQLTDQENYCDILAFTARAAENRGDFETAVLLNEAYLNTGDRRNRLPVLQSLAISHLSLGHYDDFKSVAASALKEYPEDQFLASKAFSVSQEKKDEDGMVLFGEYYARFDPSIRTDILWNKAKLLAEQQKYVDAVKVWEQLDKLSPNNEEIYRHIGFDSYNAGVLLNKQAGSLQGNKRDQMLSLSKSYFQKALPYLDDLSAQPKYRTATNFTRAMAYCHSMTGNEKAFKQDNDLLKSLGAPIVKADEEPQLQTNYNAILFNPGDKLKDKIDSQPDPPAIISDVDRDLPKFTRKNEKTYVAIFGNEKYNKINVDVKYALNDARSFKKYCMEVLGIPESHIRMNENATALEMNTSINFLRDKATKNPDELRFIIFYAGHGTPDVEQEGVPYLLPCDADGSDLSGCLSLKDMYSKLEVLPTRGVTVFLDACFTGFSREGKSLVDGRWVSYAPKKTEVNKKLVVFSATSDKQRALPFDEQGHGFFTYYLLKNLKETAGRIDFGKLATQLEKQVDNEAKDRTNFNQTPQVNASKALGDSWKSWTLTD